MVSAPPARPAYHAYAMKSNQSSQEGRCTQLVEIMNDFFWVSDANAWARIRFDLCTRNFWPLAIGPGENKCGPGSKKVLSGLSVRLTEALAVNWGHLQSQAVLNWHLALVQQPDLMNPTPESIRPTGCWTVLHIRRFNQSVILC